MRGTRFAVVFCLLGAVGCSAAFVPPGPDGEAKLRASSAAPPVPISAEQVTAQNAHLLTQALADELDRDVNRDLLGAPPGGATKK